MVFDDRVKGRVSIRGVFLTLLLAVICLPSLATAFPQTGSAGASSGSSNSQAAAGVASQTGDLFNYISSASESAGASASNSSASADVGSADGTAEPSSTSGASSSDAVSDDPRPAQRSLSRTSKVFSYEELTRTAESVIPFPNGRGLVRITTKEDGSLVVSVEEAAQGTGSAAASNTYRSENGATSRYYYDPNYLDPTRTTQSAPESSASTGTGSNTSSGVTWPTSATEPTDRTVATYPTLQVNADGEDSAMLDLNVQLAEVNVQEKQAQLEIVKKEGADDAHLRLAGLAVQRAEIELQKAQIRQKRGSRQATGSPISSN